jgi:hypothetical protein
MFFEGVEKIERAHIVVMLSTSMSFLSPFFSLLFLTSPFYYFEKAMMMSGKRKILQLVISVVSLLILSFNFTGKTDAKGGKKRKRSKWNF